MEVLECWEIMRMYKQRIPDALLPFKNKANNKLMFFHLVYNRLFHLITIHPLWMTSKKKLTPGHN